MSSAASSDLDFVGSDSDVDAVFIGRDDISNYNPEQILPEDPKNIQKIRSWLQPTSYDIAGGEYRKHLASHVDGTGSWLTSSTEYKDWLQGDEHGLLWIKGIPGSGKSVMAASLIDEISRSHPACPVLFFFFRQIIDANHQPEALLRDWMDQVLDYSPPLQKQLMTYVDSRRTLASISTQDMWRDLRMGLAGLLGKVFCVADALDEMDRGNDTFLQALGNLGRWKPEKVKVLITSRPVPAVEAPLRRIPCLHIRLQESLVDRDISTFVHSALSKSTIPESEWQTIADAVPGQANGLFLYAKLAMDAFLEPGADIKTVLSQLPADLNVLYTDLLKEHAQRSGIAPEIQYLILQSVTHATRPLRLLELAEMIKVVSPDGSARDLKTTKDLIRAACGPLLEILADETVSVIHHSFTEYLKGATRPDDGSGYPILKAGPTHAQLALACLRYLQAGCLNNVEIEDDPQWDPEMYDLKYDDSVPDEEIQQRLNHPFFNYATSHASHHVRRSEASGYDQTEVNTELHRFLGNDQIMKAWTQLKWPTGAGSVTSLHIAAQAGLLSFLKELLPNADVDACDASGRTALWWAADQGHAEVVHELIAAGANPDHDEKTSGLKPLHQAASKGYHETVRVLLEAGVDPLTAKTRENPGRWCGNAPTSTGQTPLMYACSGGRLETVEAFLPFIKDIETVHRALAWAAECGRSKLVARILQHPGVDVNAKVRGDTALFLACGNCDPETIKILLAAGASPKIDCADFGDEFAGIDGGRWYLFGTGETKVNCMHQLCGLGTRHQYGQETDPDILHTIFSLLVEAGVDIHQPDPLGATPLHGAIRSAVLTRLLLDAGADANATDNEGAAPLHKVGSMSLYSSGSTKPVDVVALLIEDGHADINLPKKNGKTPLHCLLSSHRTELINKFLQYGPDCNVVDEKGDGLLHVLLHENTANPELIEALIKHGANPNLKNRDGLTPLLSIRGHPKGTGEIIDLMVKAGANLNETDEEGHTVVFRALRNNYTALENLGDHLSRGASLSVRDFAGRTPLHEAVKYHEENLTRSSHLRDETPFDLLIRSGVDIQAVDSHGNNLLHELALRRHNHDSYGGPKLCKFWKRLISMGLDLDKKNNAGRTPLHILCAADTQSIRPTPGDCMPIDLIVSETMDVNIRDNDNFTPLHLAVTGGEFYTKTLLDAGADPLVFSREGLTPLHLAARCKASNTVGLLLDALRHKQETLGDSQGSPKPRVSSLLPESDTKRSSEAVKGVDAETFVQPDVDGTNGLTPLYYACQSGRPETVALLLEAGADVESGRVFQACLNFEVENALWMKRHLSQDGASNGGAVALRMDDKSRRPPEIQYGSWRTELNLYQTSRLDEILALLAEHGARGLDEGYVSLAADADHHYTAACMARILSNKEIGSGEHGHRSSSEAVLAEKSLALGQASLPNLKDFKPEEFNSERLSDYLIQREYYLVRELPNLGADFLPTPEKNEISPLGMLIQNGYASLVETIGTVAAESGFKKGDWHAFGDKTRPGLWFANRNLSMPDHNGHNPVPFLIDAVRQPLPNMDMVRLLVEKFGVDINEQQHTSKYEAGQKKADPSDAPIHCVVQGGWWHVHQALPYLLQAGVDLEIRNQEEETPLHVVLQGDGRNLGIYYRTAVKMLVEAGADVNALDGKGRSCLSCAQHDIETVKLLVSHGANVTADALLAAIDAKNVGVLRELLSSGVDANIRCPKQKKARPLTASVLEPHENYPLYYAAIMMNMAAKHHVEEEMIQLLLEHGADPFAKFLQKDRDGESSDSMASIEVPQGYREGTVLHELILSGKMIDMFLRIPGLDVSHRDAKGRTLLLVACQANNLPDSVIDASEKKEDERESDTVFQRLLALGSDIEARDAHDRNVLHSLIGRESDRRTFNGLKQSLAYVLREAPGLINQADADGRTPLNYAVARAVCYEGTEKIAPMLLEAGADPLVVDNNGDNLLHVLAQNLDSGSLRGLFRTLIERGVDLEGRNAQGRTPLFVYSRREIESHETLFAPISAYLVEEQKATLMLQELGADFFARDAKGRGLLHVAAEGDVVRFKELLDLGLDPMLEDDAQRTAIDVAAACGNKPIMELFKKKD